LRGITGKNNDIEVDHDEEEALILSLYPPVTTKRFPFERK
jgi:hypothetical protein